jgi:hypothetical protein
MIVYDSLHSLLDHERLLFRCDEWRATNHCSHPELLLNELQTESESESESEILYDWRFTANQFVSATSPLRLTTSNLIFQLNTFGYSPFVASTLTSGWVCRLQLLLVLISAVILRSESRGTHDHILLSQIRDSPNLQGQVPVFISPRNRVARLHPHGNVFINIRCSGNGC